MTEAVSGGDSRFSFGRGASGFIIVELQRALGISADGEFGPATERRICELQHGARLSITGRAGALEFHAAGLPWPDEFQRCMNLVSCFEGTSFGDCNTTDIDGAGLTIGIAGFTSLHGEVQMLLAEYFSDRPEDMDRLLPRAEAELLGHYLSRATPHSAWRSLFYDARGRVKSCWQTAFRELGRSASMQQLQLRMAHNRFWKPAIAAAARAGFASLQAKCFFLDVAVQNGGWRGRHEAVARQDSNWSSRNERVRLAVAARAVAGCAKQRWQADVLARKLTIAQGSGIVHGRLYSLRNFALV